MVQKGGLTSMSSSRESALRAWLCGKMKQRPIGDCVSRCKRIAKSLGVNLDEAWKADRGSRILNILTYTRED